MVNATCDFCENSYRKNPNVGYFKVTEALKISLCLREGAGINTICGEHFSPNEISESGRLQKDAKPVFFHRKSTAEHDHNYFDGNLSEDEEEDAESLPLTPNQPELVEDFLGVYVEDGGDDPGDEDFLPSQGQESGSSATFLNPSSQHIEDSLKEPKVIVYISLLLKLFSICQREACGSAIDPSNIQTYERGACLVVSGVCNNHHSFKWSSSPMKGKGRSAIPAINVLLAAYTLLCGMHVDQVIAFFKHLDIAVPGPCYFYQLFTSLIYKCIWSYWLEMQANLIRILKSSGDPVNIGGDGKYDSPGFSARYCTYYMMNLADRSIIALWVAVKHQVSSSSAMEPFACKTLLLFLIENFQLKINSLTTDRSSNIKQMMLSDERLNGVKHCYDVWHFIKSVLKDLWDLSKRKYAKKLSLWITSITNMLWWTFSTSRDEETLKEKILSIPRHVTNRHSFPSNQKHKRCAHSDLTGAESRKPWLKEDSKEVGKLVAALRGHKDIRLNDLANMTEFHHTGFIENVNSLNTKYCSKTYVYGYDSMLVRAAITAIDHNLNLNRPQAITKKGEPKYKLECNRAGSKYIVREIKVPKDTIWRDKIADFILQCVDTNTVPIVEIPVGRDIPRNQAKIPRPIKSEAIKHHQSRMNM